MEDENIHDQHNNLLELKLPSCSSSNPLLIPPPPDADALLDLFNHNHGAPVASAFTNALFTNSPMYDPHHHHPSSSSPSFMAPPEISSSSFVDPTHALIKSNGVMGGKRRKMGGNKGGGMEKPREVIHVRAKRGQATDSHSLAERVRRERINEKLKVLQDLVPGCYKTMGMAVMLDVIINYVRNLQNQIEFLSMKLSAASMFYDFNSPEAEAMEAFQMTNPCEAREMERMMRDEGFLYQSAGGLASSDPLSEPPPSADHHPPFAFPF